MCDEATMYHNANEPVGAETTLLTRWLPCHVSTWSTVLSVDTVAANRTVKPRTPMFRYGMVPYAKNPFLSSRILSVQQQVQPVVDIIIG